TSMTSVGAPSRRERHTAVWTGSEMIVWGGIGDPVGFSALLGDGARYDPVTDTWSPMSSLGAPTPRVWHTAIWTGSHMIVWGGQDDSLATDDGAMYDPETDTWTTLESVGAPSRRELHAAVWSGSEMIVWGGRLNDSTRLSSGGRFTP